MKKIIILALLVICTAGIFSAHAFDKKAIIGYLDGKAVVAADLENYVNSLLGDAYKGKLKTEKGIKELFNNYVNREIILVKARKEIKDDDSFVTQHTMGHVDKDSSKISALLKKEVNDKVKISKEEIEDFFLKSGMYKTMQEAERVLISKKRVEVFNKYLANLRAQHDIKLNI